VEGLLLVAVTLAIASGFGVWWRRRTGRMTAVAEAVFPAAELGLAIGDRATLVQFTSAFCAPCRATRRILTEVAAMVDGVAYAEVDAERHLDVVRRMHVARTPTTFVLDRAGRVVVRASGQPRKVDVVAALGKALGNT
jgi:thiol-disulfide isomerase/thioredoxin